jgi:ABC-type amino acid transport substrate-binding protein
MKRLNLLNILFVVITIILSDVLSSMVYAAEFDLLKSGVVAVAHDTSFPPYEWVENGNSTGFNVEVVKAVIEKMGLKVEFRPDVWANVLASVKVRKADAILSVEIEDEKKKSYDFSDSYASFGSTLFVKAEDTTIQSLKDLDKKVVAGQKDSYEILYVRKTYPAIQPYMTEDPMDAMQSVLNDKAAGCVVDKQVGLHLINQNFPGKLKSVGEEFNKIVSGLAVLKGTREEFLKKFNQTLTEIKADGTYDRIRAKWFK